MLSRESIQAQIKAMLKQKSDREADLKRHQEGRCRCAVKFPLRCSGMQKAAKSIIADLRGQIYQLRQLELQAITKEKANETAFQVHGSDSGNSNSRREVRGRGRSRRRNPRSQSSKA